MNWVFYIIIGIVTFIPSLWFAIKGKQWANNHFFKGDVDESSPKSWPGDFLATSVFFIYAVVMYGLMPKF